VLTVGAETCTITLKDPTQKHSFFAILENTYKKRHQAITKQKKNSIFRTKMEMGPALGFDKKLL
jgi:hypothetical protein